MKSDRWDWGPHLIPIPIGFVPVLSDVRKSITQILIKRNMYVILSKCSIEYIASHLIKFVLQIAELLLFVFQEYVLFQKSYRYIFTNQNNNTNRIKLDIITNTNSTLVSYLSKRTYE